VEGTASPRKSQYTNTSRNATVKPMRTVRHTPLSKVDTFVLKATLKLLVYEYGLTNCSLVLVLSHEYEFKVALF